MGHTHARRKQHEPFKEEARGPNEAGALTEGAPGQAQERREEFAEKINDAR